MEITSESKVPEFEPPQACVNRVIKAVLAENVQVTKDARESLFSTLLTGMNRNEYADFLMMLASANDFCKENKRQTIYPQDILDALRELDFEEFEKPVADFLEECRLEKSEKARGRKSNEGEDEDEDEADDAESDPHAAAGTSS